MSNGAGKLSLAKTIRCRNCGTIGIHNFQRKTIYSTAGPALDVVSCLICSDWYASRLLVPPPPEREIVFNISEAISLAMSKFNRPCKRRGCDGVYSSEKSKIFLCQSCKRSFRYHNWLHGVRKSAAPLVLLRDGTYVSRQEFSEMVDEVEVIPAPSTRQKAARRIERGE